MKFLIQIIVMFLSLYFPAVCLADMQDSIELDIINLTGQELTVKSGELSNIAPPYFYSRKEDSLKIGAGNVSRGQPGALLEALLFLNATAVAPVCKVRFAAYFQHPYFGVKCPNFSSGWGASCSCLDSSYTCRKVSQSQSHEFDGKCTHKGGAVFIISKK